MELWHFWTSILQSALTNLSTHFGLSEAMAVVLLTVLCRTILMPVSLMSALRVEANKAIMKRIKPQLDALREHHSDDRAKVASETLRIYRENNFRLFDRLALTNIGTQSLFGIGMFQVLNRASLSSRFLWIASLAKPDFLLTLVVSALMLLGMALMPGATDQGMLIMMTLSVLVTVITLSALPSAVGVYWAASNVVTIAQAAVLRAIIRHRSRLVSSE